MTRVPIGALPALYADERPEAPCLIYGERVMTWRELDRNANRLANALREAGVSKDDFVTLALANGFAFHESAFAVWKLGAIPNIVSPRLPAGELDDILALAQPRLILTDDPEMLRRPEAAEPGRLMAMGADRTVEPVVGSHWKAVTSGGSTGRPKIIVDSQPGSFDLSADYMRLPRNGVTLNPAPLYYAGPFTLTHLSLFRGNCVVGMPRFEPEAALRMLSDHRVSWTWMVPTMMHRIWRLPPNVRRGADLSALATLWHAAGPMPPALKRAWIEWLGGDRIWETYAGSERLGSTVISGDEWLEREGSVGRPTAEAEIMVLRDDGQPADIEEVGEIFFLPATGSCSTFHYIGAERRLGPRGMESLGDFGWFDADGYLYLADRRVDRIVSGGVNVYPAEIESELLAHEAIEGAVVIGLADEDLGERVHALVRLASGWKGRIGEDELNAFLADRLARPKRPRSFEFVEEVLRDDGGKVRRVELQRRRQGSSD